MRLTSTQAEVLDRLRSHKRIEPNDLGSGFALLRPGDWKPINITGTLKALARLGLAEKKGGSYVLTDEGQKLAAPSTSEKGEDRP